jgi:hypothetical protein
MILKGTIQGEASRGYGGYSYRRAVIRPISCIWDIDPDRFYADKPYPRFTGIHQLQPNYIELLDYEIRTIPGLRPLGGTGQVWIMPGPWSPKGLEPVQVLEFVFSAELMLGSNWTQEIEDFAIKEAFR